MKKIIDGKLYDSSTANLVVDIGTAQVYQKRTGEYFIMENNDIIRITAWALKQWARDRGMYDDIFGASSDRKETLLIELDSSLKNKLKTIAADTGRTMKDIVTSALETSLKEDRIIYDNHSGATFEYDGRDIFEGEQSPDGKYIKLTNGAWIKDPGNGKLCSSSNNLDKYALVGIPLYNDDGSVFEIKNQGYVKL